jgi:NAD(P)H dehydrogenase (quinone)
MRNCANPDAYRQDGGATGVREFITIGHTSLLHADRSTSNLANEHRRIEAFHQASQLRTAILRNGWYSENHLRSLRPTIERGTFFGAASDGRISSATRAD